VDKQNDLKVWQLDPAQITPFYNIAVCDALHEEGCSVQYFTSEYLYDRFSAESLRVEKKFIYFRGLNRQWLLRYPRLRRLLRGISYPVGHLNFLGMVRHSRPDIVHIQWSRIPKFDLWLIKQIQTLGIPVVHTVHDVVPMFAAGKGAKPFEKIYSTVDHLIVHTEANRRDFLTAYPLVPSNKLTVVPLIEFQDNRIPDYVTQREARQLLKLPLDAFILGFFGSIRYYKGLDVLLSAFERARTIYPDLHLIISGKMDPLEREKLPTIESINLMPNVHLFEGYIPSSDVWLYHLAPDVFVLPYRHIYQSAALITAMGYGCPIVATSVGGIPETIDGNGWVVPPENAEELAKVILEIVSNRSQLARMSERSRELVRERHSKALVAQALLNVYRKLL
jgi:glycosyltransferase involved in cell wall biosynthesis